MDADWITSPSARRVLQHADDPRPAWLWSQDGQLLLWRNAAAELFLAKRKKHGLKLAAPAVPIKGQVARNIRLGSTGRTSLARIQFIAGEKPASSTCATTPLTWQDGQTVLLIVGVDPIDADVLEAAVEAQQAPPEAPSEPAIAPGAEEAEAAPQEVAAPFDDLAAARDALDEPVTEPPAPSEEPEVRPSGLSPAEVDATAYARELESWRDAEHEGTTATEPDETGSVEEARQPDEGSGQELSGTEGTAGSDVTADTEETAVRGEPDEQIDAELPAAEEAGVSDVVAEPEEPVIPSQPEEQVEQEPPAFEEAIAPDLAAEAKDLAAPDEQAEPDRPVARDPSSDDFAVEPVEASTNSRLSSLIDRLANDEGLFTPLTEADDVPPQPLPDSDSTDDAETAASSLFKVTGRRFIPLHPGLEQDDAEADLAELARLEPGSALESEAEAETETSRFAMAPVAEAEADAAELEQAPKPAPEAKTPATEPAAEDEVVERISAELANQAAAPVADVESVERVSRYNFDELSRILTDRIGEGAQPAKLPAETSGGGALINLGGETLVLNRLPLGILVFRDQQVLFANRAITEMVGYSSVESLRAAGLAAVFPAAGPEGQDAGPVNHLVQRDGTLVPVTARLQSISWQGRPALMLSASTTEVRTGHEGAVRAFAQTFADMRGDGFFETTRAGVVSAITGRGAELLRVEGMIEGKSLTAVVAEAEIPSLREFLERPARFAETARPCLTLRASSGSAEIILFAQGQAGVLTGCFGFVRAREPAPLRLTGPAEADPALLARISRSVRRPLNTIIGFSDLIRTEAFGALKNERYESYAQDIASAGNEIAALVDELDDYARLRDGRYLPQRASIALTGLLESCVLRIRQQASSARVIVRNAISESLPRITADRASLAQAVLNLLASAIDQTPAGGAVVISAQREDDGSIAVHVRDSSANAVDMAERFVVFRDGVGKNGQAMVPVRSSVGLALTRSLLAVNAFSLSVDPAGEQGMLFSLIIPADLVERPAAPETTG
jgi:signal transduction histidine kinase